MKQKFEIPCAIRLSPNDEPGYLSMFAAFTMKAGLEVPIYASSSCRLDDIIGTARFKRREDNRAVKAEVELFRVAAKYSYIETLWQAGRQLYFDVQMKRSYKLAGNNENHFGATERIEIEGVVLSPTPAYPPYYMASFFSWP